MDPDPGGPKTCGSGSSTLVLSMVDFLTGCRKVNFRKKEKIGSKAAFGTIFRALSGYLKAGTNFLKLFKEGFSESFV
jgi:hypothetical protein